MNILLVGGTGILSTAIASNAVSSGKEVWVLSRKSEWRKCFSVEGVHFLKADIRDKETVNDFLKEIHFDVIIDFISFTPENISYKLELFKGKYTQYIFISSAAVYDVKRGEGKIIEDSYPLGNIEDPYGWSKYLCECYLRDYFRVTGDGYYTIIRPGYTYGDMCVPYWLTEGFTVRGWIFLDRISKGISIPVLADTNNKCVLTHVDDFAKGMDGIYMNKSAYNEAFHITADDGIEWHGVLDLLEDAMGTKIQRKTVTPDEYLRYFPEHKEQVISAYKDALFDNSKIKRVAPSYKCTVDLYEGIERMVACYKSVIKTIDNTETMWQERILWENRLKLLLSDK